MFVKLNSNLYVNADNILTVTFIDGRPIRAVLVLTHGQNLIIAEDAAHYLLACVEAQSALASEAPETPSLKTRIAQALRYEFPNGLSKTNIHAKFFDGASNSGEIQAAISLLASEGVIIKAAGVWHHAANFKPNPDPSASDASSSSTPAEHNENS